MPKILLALACVLPLCAQDVTIAGCVTNQAGQPLKDARVDLRSAGQPQRDLRFDTDENGNFTITNIEPGRYQLDAGRNGYLWFQYPAPLVLRAGQRLTGLVLKMTREAILSGKILDQDGDPVPTAEILLLNQQKMPQTNAKIRADGSFVLGDLKAGSYYLSIADQPAQLSRAHEILGPRQGYVETYYPGVTDPARATLIHLEAGAEIRDLDFRIVASAVSRLRGHVVDGSGAPVGNAVLNMLFTAVQGLYQVATASAEGNFELHQVPPGDYVIRAAVHAGPAADTAVGHTRITVGANNIDGLVVRVSTPVQVSGAVVIEGGGGAGKVRVAFDGKEGWWVSGGQVDSKPDGSFLFNGVEAAPFFIDLKQLPAGAYLKSILWGGQPLTDNQLDLSQGTQGKTLEVVLSPHAAEVRGLVHDSKGGIAAGVEVTLRTAALSTRAAKAEKRNTDQTGAFAFGNLAPGVYLLGVGDQPPQTLIVAEDARIRVDDLSVP